MDDKNYIVDPFTCLCKIALLYFMPIGTKLSINHHVLHIQKPTSYQWIERLKNRDAGSDISHLNVPFIKAMKWYVLECDERMEMSNETRKGILLICDYAILSLKKLQTSTYENDYPVKLILQHFVNMFNNAIKNKWDDEMCMDPQSEEGILTDKIKNNIDENKIKSICTSLTDAGQETNTPNEIDAYVECIHKLLNDRDISFVQMMRNINTIL